ncbi:tagatose-6-phosphate kinase [Peptoniphilus sp. MSJ-1]|uniref:Tagatose-6-phosphate kinase n=1 Tax=Peptoniphilus ovalis TaxID=2841503 RepID=A0ABS6FIL7_9FIRM|nr:tagatose-6-phosphate kinase [Peptoniphilus ovalis]MBU5669347.1 tagatose-6-phosphate kinase [Peptoniphilus ovalis]
MILFCDFNPKIVREYKLDDSEKEEIINSKFYPSGHGIDMSFFTRALGVESEVFMLKGNKLGREIALNLSKLGIDITPINLKDDNIEEVVIDSDKSQMRYRTKEPRITMEDRAEILNSFERTLYNNSIAVIPKIDLTGLDSSLYEKLVKICYKNNTKVIVNTSDLTEIERSNPYILVYDKNDIEEKRKINYTGEVIEFNKKFLKMGTKIVVANSKRFTIISTEDKNYRAYLDKQKFGINEILDDFNTDLSIAGLSIALDREYDFITSMKLLIASGVWQNFKEQEEIDMSYIKKLMNSVIVEEI